MRPRNPKATVFSASVVPRVNTMQSSLGALMKRATVRRASSSARVEAFEVKCMPRWTLPFSVR